LIDDTSHDLNSEGPSPRDDLESLAYTAVCLLKGTLPWEGYNRKSNIQQLKIMMTGEVLAAGLPKAFGDFFDYARGLEHHEQPNYQHWKSTFLILSNESGNPLNSNFGLDAANGGHDIVDQIPWHISPRMSESSSDSTGDEEDDDFEDDDYFLPKLDWPAPQGVKEQDLLGDEERIIQESEVAILTTPPTVFKGILDLYYPEKEKMII
jgi:hypothetical protein